MNINLDSSNQYLNISIVGMEKNGVSFSKKKINELNFFSKAKIYLTEKIGEKKYVKLAEDNNQILVKISEISDKLGISRQEIIKSEKENNLNNLLALGVEAKTYHVNSSVVLEYQNQGNLENLRYLEYLSDSLYLPLSELLEAKKNERLQECLENAELVEQRCYETFQKLDKLYDESDGMFLTKNAEEKIKLKMDQKELNVIKSVIRIAYKTLKKHPDGSNRKLEQVIPITEDYRILVKSSEDSLEITGLFGRLLGHGAFGVAVHTVDLLEGKWRTGEEAVLKIPSMGDKNSKQIIQEEKLLSKIHGENSVLGIQKKLKLVRNIFSGEAKHCHLGSLYQMDLFEMILHPEKKKSINQEDKTSLAYQLLYGMAHMHSQGITHGDIIPQNIFYTLSEENPAGPLIFLSDFGGGIDHLVDDVPLQLTTSSEYRLDQDDMASNTEKNQLSQEKEDVFAACCVICSIFTNEEPYDKQPGSGKFAVNKDLQEQLISHGMSLETAQLVIQGLEIDNEKQPNAKELFEGFQKELATIDPKRSALLRALTLPMV